MKKADKSLIIFVAAVLIIGGIVAGVGFIPITKQVAYTCTKTEEYPCLTTETYTCTKIREVPCTRTETYEYTVTVPYTEVEETPLSYSTWGSGAGESWWDCDVWAYTNVRNLDTQGGYFTVTFKCYYEGAWNTKTVTKYVAPGTSEEFKVEFYKDCGVSWSWNKIVTPDTKEVVVQKYRTETRTGVHEVEDTCPEAYETTCIREVEDTCTRQYQDTCYREEKRPLLW